MEREIRNNGDWDQIICNELGNEVKYTVYGNIGFTNGFRDDIINDVCENYLDQGKIFSIELNCGTTADPMFVLSETSRLVDFLRERTDGWIIWDRAQQPNVYIKSDNVSPTGFNIVESER